MKKWYKKERNADYHLGFKKAKKDSEANFISQEYVSESWQFVQYTCMQEYLAEQQNVIWVDPQHRYVDVDKDRIEVKQKIYVKASDSWKDGPGTHHIPKEVLDHYNTPEVVKLRGIKFELKNKPKPEAKAKKETTQETNS